MDCSPPSPSVHGILQARILEWSAMPSSRDLLNQGVKPVSKKKKKLSLLNWQAGSLPLVLPGKSHNSSTVIVNTWQIMDIISFNHSTFLRYIQSVFSLQIMILRLNNVKAKSLAVCIQSELFLPNCIPCFYSLFQGEFSVCFFTPFKLNHTVATLVTADFQIFVDFD